MEMPEISSRQPSTLKWRFSSYFRLKMDPASIADVELVDAVTKEVTSFREVWKDQTCVIIFLRRFGWPFCRLAAKEISSLVPQLKQNNVRYGGYSPDRNINQTFRLVGIGLESIGLDEFLEGKYFDGDLFVDDKKTSYDKLGFQRMGLMELLPSAMSRKWMEAGAKAFSMNLGGNIIQGDGYQKGGCLVVGKGGDPVLFSYVQQDAADHPDNQDILKALNLQ